MSVMSFVKKLFIDSGSSEEKTMSLEDIRTRIFEARRNMEMRNREAALAEQKAQNALQKTFQSGISQMERKNLLAEHARCMREAKSLLGYANQFSSVLETLETAETFMELSEAVAQSDIAGAGKMDIKEIMTELQQMQATLGPMMAECEKLKRTMAMTAEGFDGMLSQEESEEQKELMALYAKHDAERDPVKRAAIQAEIQKRSAAMLSSASV